MRLMFGKLPQERVDAIGISALVQTQTSPHVRVMSAPLIGRSGPSALQRKTEPSVSEQRRVDITPPAGSFKPSPREFSSEAAHARAYPQFHRPLTPRQFDGSEFGQADAADVAVVVAAPACRPLPPL